MSNPQPQLNKLRSYEVNLLESLADILQYLKDHPEVTWSGAGLTALAVLYFPVAKLFAFLFRKDEGPSVSNTFTHSGSGDQNLAQGPNAIGMQENVTQKMDGDGNIFSGTGNVTVIQGLRMKSHTAVLAGVLLAGIGGGAYYLFAPAGKNASSQGDNSPAIVAEHAEVNYNSSGVDPELLAKYAEDLGATKQLIRTFLGTLLKEKISRDQWDSKLREIAAIHKELLDRLATVQSEDPEVQRLKQEAGQAIEAGQYGKAEELLNQAEARDLEAIEQMEQAARQRRISAAATNADQAKLQEVQLRYAKAAEYWQKAADLLPETEKKDKAYYLNQAGYDLDRISRYSEALPLYEQSLAIRQEIGDRAGEAVTSWNIGMIYKKQGNLAKAEQYMARTVAIDEAIGHPDLESDRKALEKLRLEIKDQ